MQDLLVHLKERMTRFLGKLFTKASECTQDTIVDHRSIEKLKNIGDEREGINFRPPPNNDGTPSESVSDVLIRQNQLVSTIEVNIAMSTVCE